MKVYNVEIKKQLSFMLNMTKMKEQAQVSVCRKQLTSAIAALCKC